MTSPCRPLLGAGLAALAACAAWSAAACPADTTPRATDVVLTVQGAGPQVRALTAAVLSTLAPVTLTQRQTVSSTAGGSSERSLSYTGPLLREVLLRAGFGTPEDRGARFALVETVATDGYRASFSWGELFNSALGDQVIVITAQDGQPLDAAAGPLALRSLADFRPGPRHVRNLCAVIVRRP